MLLPHLGWSCTCSRVRMRRLPLTATILQFECLCRTTLRPESHAGKGWVVKPGVPNSASLRALTTLLES